MVFFFFLLLEFVIIKNHSVLKTLRREKRISIKRNSIKNHEVRMCIKTSTDYENIEEKEKCRNRTVEKHAA